MRERKISLRCWISSFSLVGAGGSKSDASPLCERRIIPPRRAGEILRPGALDFFLLPHSSSRGAKTEAAATAEYKATDEMSPTNRHEYKDFIHKLRRTSFFGTFTDALALAILLLLFLFCTAPGVQ